MVKNPPSNAGDLGSIPGLGTKFPDTTGQLENNPTCSNEDCVPQLKPNTANR